MGRKESTRGCEAACSRTLIERFRRSPGDGVGILANVYEPCDDGSYVCAHGRWESSASSDAVRTTRAPQLRKPRSLPTTFAFLMSAWFIFFGTPKSAQNSLMYCEWYEIALPRTLSKVGSPSTSLAKRTAGEKGPSLAGPIVTAAARVAGMLAARTGAFTTRAVVGAITAASTR